MTKRVLFYVQHLLGIGHLVRASRIALACREAGLDITLVTGGLPVAGFPAPGTPHIQLPPIAARDGAFAGLVDGQGDPVDAAFLDRRRDLLLATFRDLRPHIVMTEAFPFGRRQVRFELLPLIDEIARTAPRAKLVASLRDILQQRAKPARDQETADLVRARYDLVLVHGDPAFAALEDTFPLHAQVADRVAYTGLVCGPVPPVPSERFDVIVSAGGGAVGAGVARAALDAAALMPDLARWLVIAGPNLAEPEDKALAFRTPLNATLARFRSDFNALLAGAKVSVSQAGYNTVGDLLRARCRAILVPYVTGGETEQADRAARLAKLGLATVVGEAALDGPGLAAAIRQAMASDAPATQAAIATDGARRTAELLAGL